MGVGGASSAPQVITISDDGPAVGGAGSRGTTASEGVNVDGHGVAPVVTADGGADGAPATAPAAATPVPADGGDESDTGDEIPRTYARIWGDKLGQGCP
eukprot:9014847-Alexandrium_andersonii.AAC.1